MNKIEFNVTGPDRKNLVTAMGEILGVKPKYLGMPTAAYEVGGFTVDRDGTVTGDGLEKLLEQLAAKGITPPQQEAEPVGLTIEIPQDKVQIQNLARLIEAKGKLIGKSLGVDSLRIEVRESTVAFPWFEQTPDADMAKAAATLIAALCRMSVERKRITCTEKEVDNEKYAFRCFLLRLGFIGDEYKAERKTLLKNLVGNSAFKSGKRKDCLSCSHSFSEPGAGDGDTLHCMERNGEVVNESGYCESWN